MIRARTVNQASGKQPLTAQDIARVFGEAELLAREWKCTKCRARYKFDVPSLPPDGGCRRCQGICWVTPD